MVEEDGAGVDGRADGAEGDVPAHLPAHLVHRVDVECHRVLKVVEPPQDAIPVLLGAALGKVSRPLQALQQQD